MGKPQAKLEWHSRLKINCNLLLRNTLLSVWVMWKRRLWDHFRFYCKAWGAEKSDQISLSLKTVPETQTPGYLGLAGGAPLGKYRSSADCKNSFIKLPGLSSPFREGAGFYKQLNLLCTSHVFSPTLTIFWRLHICWIPFIYHIEQNQCLGGDASVLKCPCVCTAQLVGCLDTVFRGWVDLT